MTTLVTGATGGLGRLLCEALTHRAGGDLVGVARHVPPGKAMLACDVADGTAVSRLVAQVRPRLIYHLAGSFSQDYEADYALNTLAARHLIEAVAANGLDSRIVLMGSAAEYGLLLPQDNPVTEQQVLRPVSVYGLTKAYQTQMGVYFAHARGTDVLVARMFNLMATGLSERLFVGRVERLIDRYQRGEIERIEVGNLDARRDYVGGGEAVAQLEAIAARGARGEVYHVASGRAVAMRDILQEMLDAAAVPRAAVVEGAKEAGGRTGYDVPVICADMTRTRSLMEEA